MDKTELLRKQELKAKEFAHNLTLLNKCNNNYKRLVIAYLFSLTFFPLLSFFLMLGSVFADDTIFLTFESMIVYSLAIYCAWQAAHNKRDLFVLFTGGLAVFNQILLIIFKRYANGEYLKYFKFDSVGYTSRIHLGLLLVILIIVTVNMKTNRTFHKLEEADGYPNFNERFFEQDMTSRQMKISDPYQEKFDALRKTASSEMTEIAVKDGTLAEHVDDYRNEYMNDV
ncbi:MAG: hypothetical protein IKW96_01805 [Ruminococcus sp.]|uniref:hypothetical protein n=1 Tax=Ruminococcus sp. TaxID=41978 RepID=UPI0025F371D2|nr:hypothetical protein [Ruminococcus sp.]MBR5682003.1 hypothetical protein [Ruminococcus sp.]